MEALVDTAWLGERLDAPDLRVIDVRWYLDPARKGRDAYRAGHVPGAVFLDLDTDLSAPGGGRGAPRGRHPWPSEEQVARVARAFETPLLYNLAPGGRRLLEDLVPQAHGQPSPALPARSAG